MFVFVTFKRSVLLSIILITIILAFSQVAYNISPVLSSISVNEEHMTLLEDIFKIRNRAFLDDNLDMIASLYNKKTKLGTWAYEHQAIKMEYLHSWANKQGIEFTDIKTKIKIRYVKERDCGYLFNFLASTEYHYNYVNQPETKNFFRIGTYHSLNVDSLGGKWLISKEWYTDPFADSLDLDNEKKDEYKKYILDSKPKSIENTNKRRKGVIGYADLYCGAASDGSQGFSYNKKYKDYNPIGGDCTNFVSQTLFEGGKFRQTGEWRYEKDGSRAWVSAQGFNSFMLYSGRGSLIAKGSYNQVFKASFKLLPGDYIAYERKGKIAHISVVTGEDSKGYALVNSHNTDRYRVPWDLGWNNKGIKFWLVRVNY